ncbi:N-acetyltransferase [Pilimelia terevasa]|uniref:N-acetyltransferase n=1 Tax=Pilimelia terevasa TaxID=53372 RepID=A0A8J3BLX9_9ACTN|nr:GNAT family protein [Pilimelia terevasa]GGK18628.1 N-acetyltransferase [Pilimelia terevasa]
MLTVEKPIVTSRLLLRPFVPADVEALHVIRTEPDVLRYLYWPPATLDEVREVVDRRRTMNRLVEENDYLVLAAVCRDTGRLVGEVDLCWTSVAHRHGEFGVILHPRAQGRGLATEAGTALLDLAFGQLGLHRVSARTDSRNAACVAVLRRLGMRQEAHLRECVRFAGQWYDELVLAVLAGEWAARGD